MFDLLLALVLVFAPLALTLIPDRSRRPLQTLPPATADDEVVLIRRIHAARTVC